MTESPLVPRFETYFSVVAANTADLLEKVYQLRHQVYCEELGYEQQRASQLEHDEYDKRSIHCLLFHRSSQTYVGCVRLILADSQKPEVPFPFERACGESLEWDFDSSAATSRRKYGEISRLAIAANFRRRRGEASVANGGSDSFDARVEDERRLFPSVALGLYLAITAMGLNQGLEGVFAMMEPRLARQLRRFGIHFQQVGAEVQHRGIRAPFFISRDNLFNNLKPECRVLLDNIQKQLKGVTQENPCPPIPIEALR
jgi:N-acyl amino acid synthase of PEP-CTERM/exosortase system